MFNICMAVLNIGSVSQCCRVATVREKYVENGFFSRSGKSGNFVDGQGNLERTWKVREKSGNFVVGQENLERTLKVREFCGWPGKFIKDLEDREFENK